MEVSLVFTCSQIKDGFDIILRVKNGSDIILQFKEKIWVISYMFLTC